MISTGPNVPFVKGDVDDFNQFSSDKKESESCRT
jgi:hypothetical protein